MKRILLALSTVLMATQFASAQCTPDPQYTQPGFYPDSLTGLTDACTDLAYDQTITVVGISDTTLMGFTVAVDSISIDNVSGLPGSLSFACGSANCMIYPAIDPTSCIQLSGTPTVGDLGPHALLIEYTAHVTVPIIGTQAVPLTQGYTLNVVTCSAGLNDLNQAEKTLLKITDLMGRETKATPNTPLLYHYSDGSTERKVNLK